MAPSRTLSRDEIVRAAHARRAETGLESITLRRLADDLGVSVMGLYRHIKDKDDLLLVLTDDLLREAGLPPADLPWDRHLAEIAGSLRRLFATDPGLVDVYNRRPVTSPAARARLQASCEIMVAAGFTRAEALDAYATVHTYTVGYSALEKGRRGFTPVDDAADEWVTAIEGFVTDEQYRAGLDAVLAGLAVRSGRPLTPADATAGDPPVPVAPDDPTESQDPRRPAARPRG